jgi:multidrug resistance efflux pump
MVERIRELEAERDQQQAKIGELKNQAAIKESENATHFRETEAQFQRLEALFLHGSSSSSFPEMAQSGGHPKGGKHAICVIFVFRSVNTSIVRLDHFDDNA